MGDDRCRLESRQEPTEPDREPGIESLGRTAPRGLPDGDVKFHLGWTFEEPDQAMTQGVLLIESVNEEARRTLRATAPRRRYDVYDQRTAILLEMRRHPRASFLGYDRQATARYQRTSPGMFFDMGSATMPPSEKEGAEGDEPPPPAVESRGSMRTLVVVR
jgi:hypothetical protein